MLTVQLSFVMYLISKDINEHSQEQHDMTIGCQTHTAILFIMVKFYFYNFFTLWYIRDIEIKMYK